MIVTSPLCNANETATVEVTNLSEWKVSLVVVIGFAVIANQLLRWMEQRKLRMSVLEKCGISGPKPHFIWGNLREYSATPNVIWDSRLIEKYGPICGYYLGAKPVILVSELHLIELIQTKEGDNFLDRPRRVPGGINPDPKRALMLGNLMASYWKYLRRILDKGFSLPKLQAMAPIVQKLVEVFMSQLTPVTDFYQLYQNLTLHLIGKTGFGIDSDIQSNPNAAIKSAVEQEFSKSTGTFLLRLSLSLPEIRWLHQPIRVKWEQLKNILGVGGHSELWDLIDVTVKKRLNSVQSTKTSSTSDFLQSMVNSVKCGKLGEDSVVPNSVLFFEAGFETMSASLAFITYLLMKNPEVQDNIRNEILDVLNETNGTLSVDKLPEFHYLEAVIKEALRMYPPQTTFIGRSGMEDLKFEYTWKNELRKIVIPKNVHIQVALHQILNSEEIWDSPRKFSPQRFLEGDGAEVDEERRSRQTIAFQPFGKGKRMCIGRKYAMMVLKTLLIKLLSKNVLVSSPSHQDAMEKDGDIAVVYKTATMTPKNGVIGEVKLAPLFDMSE